MYNNLNVVQNSLLGGIRTKTFLLIADLHFESPCKILPSTIQLIAKHLHSQPLHQVGSFLLKLGQHEHSLSSQVLQF